MARLLKTTEDRRILGWFFFDWASQPYATLLMTFVFAPYIKEILGDGSLAQSVWGYGIGAAGLVIAVLAPLLGVVADRAGGRMGFVLLFSLLYVLGAWGLWLASPSAPHLLLVMISFGLGLAAMEFATIFTNAMLPGLAAPGRIGRVSGSGWAFGYVGGLVSLVLVLGFLAENAATGRTLLGLPPLFGLDPALREGTRAVGPFVAIWYALFMLPFFLWVRDPGVAAPLPIGQALRGAWPELRATLSRLPAQRSLALYLASSMFYRDALNGLYVFGGIYAAGVLGWSVTDVGIFGILAVLTGAVFAWLGGKADDWLGPKPVILGTLVILTATTVALLFVGRERVFGIATGADSALPDIAFYLLGAVIGGAGGALQTASRTMLVRQADPARMTEAFGLYALTGKATSFVAPLAIALATHLSGSQQAGITPLIALFLLGLVLLLWVNSSPDTRLVGGHSADAGAAQPDPR